MRININPKRKLFKWGPIDGKLIYVDWWWPGMLAFSKRFYDWNDSLAYLHKERIVFFADYQVLYNGGEKNFKKSILVDKEFEKNYHLWREKLKIFLFFNKKITKQYLRKLSSKELLRDFRRFKENYVAFWEIGLLPEHANWGGEQLLKRELRKRIKDEKDLIFAIERLSAPEDFSFYQQEELDLLTLKKDKKLLDKKLKQHQQKYFWLANSYHHTKILRVGHFKKRLALYSVKAARNKIAEIKRLKKEAVADKHKVVKKFNLPKKILKMSQRLSFCIWWQDERKSYIFQAGHIIDLFLKELAERFKVNFDDLHYYFIDEIDILLNKRVKIAKSEIEKRKRHFLVYYSPNFGVRRIAGLKAKKLIEPYIKTRVNRKIKQVKGLVVSAGRGQREGRVKIISSPQEFGKMNQGDILVTSMTSPDLLLP